MKRTKKDITKRLMNNNKFLLVFSIVMAIVLWAIVKINYSVDTTRVVSDVKFSLSTAATDDSGYKYFVDEEQLYVDVEIAGKAYNINSNVISKDDIIITASEVYSDSAGYKMLSLNARFANGIGNGDARIVSVSPSTMTVYYDREITDTFNVEAELTNGTESIVAEGYSVKNLVTSMSTIEITGPATVLEKLETVYFRASLDTSLIPLTETTTMPAEIRYGFNGNVDSKYLVCNGIESNPPTVTVTVYSHKVIPTAIKYINQPSAYTAQDDNVKVNPENVTIFCNTSNAENYTRYVVETIDFRTLKNTVNVFEIPADETTSSGLLSDGPEEFKVTIDFSAMSSRHFVCGDSNFFLVNANPEYDYTVTINAGSYSTVNVIGPEESIAKITAEDIQLEINVSGVAPGEGQSLEVTNIEILTEQSADCWIYGTYTATVTATPKAE